MACGKSNPKIEKIDLKELKQETISLKMDPELTLTYQDGEWSEGNMQSLQNAQKPSDKVQDINKEPVVQAELADLKKLQEEYIRVRKEYLINQLRNEIIIYLITRESNDYDKYVEVVKKS